MPTYEYACNDCGNRLEVYQSFSDSPLEECQICGGRLRRVFHPVGVLFKGSGFYSTDSKTKRAETKTTTKSDGKDSGKSSDKPTTGAETKKSAEGAGAAGKSLATQPSAKTDS